MIENTQCLSVFLIMQVQYSLFQFPRVSDTPRQYVSLKSASYILQFACESKMTLFRQPAPNIQADIFSLAKAHRPLCSLDKPSLDMFWLV